MATICRALLLGLVVLVASASASQLFPFNLDGNAPYITGVDDGCALVPATVGLYHQTFSELHVCTNGVISLGDAFTDPMPTPFPFSGQSLIAPLWGDLDTRDDQGNGTGRVYYEKVPTDSELWVTFEELIRASEPGYYSVGQNYTATRIYLATWYQVGLYEKIFNPNNTFQVAIVTDETHYFVVFNYPEGGLNLPPANFTAGVNMGDGFSFVSVPYSDDITRATTESNVGQPGIWIWNIGFGGPIPLVSEMPTPTTLTSTPENVLVYRNINGKSNQLGFSMSGEGNEVVISQPSCSENSKVGLACGKVYLVETSSGDWRLKQYFQYLGKVEYSNFGNKVLLKGGWLLIQSLAPYNYGTMADQSTVYGFRYSPINNRYVRKFALSSPLDQTYQEFGSALAVDGNFTFISAQYAENEGVNSYGAVFGYHYPKSIDRIKGPQYLTVRSPNTDSYEMFGASVAANDGILVVSSDSETGRVHVFRYTFSEVSFVQTIQASLETSINYGLEILFEGYNLFVSSNADSTYDERTGSVYRYTLNEYGTFDEVDYFSPYDAPYRARFGVSMAYNKEHKYLVVGAVYSSDCEDWCEIKGSIYVVQDSGYGYWYQTKYSFGDVHGSDLFGRAVATNRDGIIIGAPSDDTHGNQRGAIYMMPY